MKTWIFPENQGDCEITSEWGSGYPGDAVTKKFLRDNLDPVFGFPSIVRFSWKTAETLIEDKCVKVEFEEVDPEEVNFDHFSFDKKKFVIICLYIILTYLRILSG